jgi:hypothetical protein
LRHSCLHMRRTEPIYVGIKKPWELGTFAFLLSMAILEKYP